MALESKLRSLNALGTEPVDLPPSPLRVAALDPRAAVIGNRTVGTYLVAALTQLLRQLPAGQPWQHTICLFGAERLGGDLLDRLTDACETSRTGLVAGYRSIPAPVRERLGRGNAAIAFMRLGNGDDAKAASELIGSEHRFVIGQLTDTVGTSFTDTWGDSYTSTVGTADSLADSFSISQNRGGSSGSGRSYQGGFAPFGGVSKSASGEQNYSYGTQGSVSLTKGINSGTSWGISLSRALGDNESLGRTAQRSRELLVEPDELQRLPPSAAIISYPAASGRPRDARRHQPGPGHAARSPAANGPGCAPVTDSVRAAPISPGRRLQPRAIRREPARGRARRRRPDHRRRCSSSRTGRICPRRPSFCCPPDRRRAPTTRSNLHHARPSCPFAGHPTLGTCHAWLEAGGVPASSDLIVQQCPAGLVRIRRQDGLLGFAAPPLIKSGPVEEALMSRHRRHARDRQLRDRRPRHGPTTAPAGWRCCWTAPKRCSHCSPASRRAWTSASSARTRPARRAPSRCGRSSGRTGQRRGPGDRQPQRVAGQWLRDTGRVRRRTSPARARRSAAAAGCTWPKTTTATSGSAAPRSPGSTAPSSCNRPLDRPQAGPGADRLCSNPKPEPDLCYLFRS